MIKDCAYRRIVYASRAVSDDLRDQAEILAVSRRNNGIDGISGILLRRNGRYLQLLEGPPESVASTYARIADDDRHSDIVVLDDCRVDDRQFADWAMAGMPGEHPADAAARLQMLLRNADPDVVRYFL